jgi:hypothetical protein
LLFLYQKKNGTNLKLVPLKSQNVSLARITRPVRLAFQARLAQPQQLRCPAEPRQQL